MKEIIKVNRREFSQKEVMGINKKLSNIKEEIKMKNTVENNTSISNIVKKLKLKDVSDVLMQIQKSLVHLEGTNFYIFKVEKIFYIYNGDNGIFYSIKNKSNCKFMLHIYEDCLGILEYKDKAYKYGDEIIEKAYFIIYKGRMVQCHMDLLNVIGYARGGNDGKSYKGLTFKYKNENIKVFAHTIVALIKYGYEKVSECVGYGSYMVVDHINNEKLDNRLCNIQLLTRRDNRWKKK